MRIIPSAYRKYSNVSNWTLNKCDDEDRFKFQGVVDNYQQL